MILIKLLQKSLLIYANKISKKPIVLFLLAKGIVSKLVFGLLYFEVTYIFLTYIYSKVKTNMCEVKVMPKLLLVHTLLVVTLCP